ncbi:ribosomal protein L4 domain-containing protein [Phlyctochytrium arcticum]|nr:ribosomal protein L4 domain-containing protein [Phlyctochytrium arcticum]
MSTSQRGVSAAQSLLARTLCLRSSIGSLRSPLIPSTSHFWGSGKVSASISTETPSSSTTILVPTPQGALPTRLHPLTKVVTFEDKLPSSEVETYSDTKSECWPGSTLLISSYPLCPFLDHSWKSPTVQAYLHSFTTPSPHPLGLLQLDRTVFGATVRSDLLSRAVRYEASWLAAGTESTKALGQVRTSGRKPFPQKGRGKARVRTVRAPQWRGGYRVHGPRPHNKTTEIPRKVYDHAIRSALSAKYAQDQLIIVDSLALPNSRKQALVDRLVALSLKGKRVYFVYGNTEPEKELVAAAEKFRKRLADPVRQLEKERPLLVSSAREIIVTPLLENEIVVLDKAAVEILEEMYHVE